MLDTLSLFVNKWLSNVVHFLKEIFHLNIENIVMITIKHLEINQISALNNL